MLERGSRGTGHASGPSQEGGSTRQIFIWASTQDETLHSSFTRLPRTTVEYLGRIQVSPNGLSHRPGTVSPRGWPCVEEEFSERWVHHSGQPKAAVLAV